MRWIRILTLTAAATTLAGGCDSKPEPTQPKFDLTAQCNRLGEMARTGGMIPPDLAPQKVENCQAKMAELEKASPSAFKTQSNCLMAAKDYPDAQSCVEQAMMVLEK